MKSLAIFLIVLAVIGVGIGIYYNLSEKEIRTAQDFFDYSIKHGQEVVCVGDKINTRGHDIPLCPK